MHSHSRVIDVPCFSICAMLMVDTAKSHSSLIMYSPHQCYVVVFGCMFFFVFVFFDFLEK